jgi:hypothetical protein
MSKETNISLVIQKIFKNNTKNFIFIYTPPKVGSTTLVSSLRISLGKQYNIIHIHDEVMLTVLTGIKNVSVNDIINYLSSIGKNVYVFDIYRSPIERKISCFFEKISPYHFNNSEENINQYSIDRVVNRFNKIFPYIEIDDYYFDRYNIETLSSFDFEKKYTIQKNQNITYVKLRLCDSTLWGNILSSILNQDIVIITDYQTEQKTIGDLYNKFKTSYKLPINYFDIIKNNKYLKFYFNKSEQDAYLNLWKTKLGDSFEPYSLSEYTFYMQLCLENKYINDIQYEHYIDNGCSCNLCSIERRKIFCKAKKGEKITTKIIHRQIKQTAINKMAMNKMKTKISFIKKFDSKKIFLINTIK